MLFHSQGKEPGDLTRLGILAATFSDGTIRLFSIPEPGSLRIRLGLDSHMGGSPDVVYSKGSEHDVL
jgi:hypothetical protein